MKSSAALQSVLALLLSAAAAEATVVSIPVNITTSTGSTATQSTPTAGPPPGGGVADNAINGNLGDFTHTSPPEPAFADAWWQANLATDRSFTHLRLYNRSNCCQGRFRDLEVFVYDASNNLLYQSGLLNPGNVLNGPAFIDLAMGSLLSTARIIRVERTPIPGQEATHDGATLSIGEVLVFQHTNVLLPAGTNLITSNIVAMGTSQSSTLGGFSAANAVNGMTGDFTHTLGGDANPTWTVDFGEVMNLESFSIGNRGDGCCQGRLRDIRVTVRDGSGATVFTSALLNPENVLNGPASLTGAFPGGLTGRYVDISRVPDLDWSGAGAVVGNVDDATVLSMNEVSIIGSSIPEPAAPLLALLPAAGLAFARRRR